MSQPVRSTQTQENKEEIVEKKKITEKQRIALAKARETIKKNKIIREIRETESEQDSAAPKKKKSSEKMFETSLLIFALVGAIGYTIWSSGKSQPQNSASTVPETAPETVPEKKGQDPFDQLFGKL